MFPYIIAYDLIRPDQDYAKIIAAITQLSDIYCKVLESTWLIKYNGSEESIRNHLREAVDNNDKLFVARLTGDAAWYNLKDQTSTWLKRHL